MKRFLAIFFLFAASVVRAEEGGVKRLEAIAHHYSSMGGYTIEFVLKVGDATQKGTVMVSGNNTYMRVADTEIYVQDALRYEVRGKEKEIIIDRAELYEKELFAPNGDLSKLSDEYNIEECIVEGAAAIRLSPKRTGETLYIIISADGVSVEKVLYAVGTERAVVKVERCKKGDVTVPRFSKTRYSGFETIDFR